MKIGICRKADIALESCPDHADYIEVAGYPLHRHEDELYQRIRQAVKEGRFTPYCCNALIDPELRLTGPEVNFGAIREYCDSLFCRLDELGIKMLVFGSGKAKHVPYGFPMEKAWNQLFELGHILSSKAKEHGQTVVVEPLSYTEVNIVNTLGDAVYYAKQVNQDNFKAMVDFYHFSNNKEDFSSLATHKDWIAHAHFASEGTRTPPRTEEDWTFFTQCVKKLHEIGYTGALSFEGRVAETDDLSAMLARMKEIEKSI